MSVQKSLLGLNIDFCVFCLFQTHAILLLAEFVIVSTEITVLIYILISLHLKTGVIMELEQ